MARSRSCRARSVAWRAARSDHASQSVSASAQREAPDHPEQAAVALLRLQQVVGGARVVEAEERVPGEQHGERAVVRHVRDLVANPIGGARRLEGRADAQPVAARQHVGVQVDADALAGLLAQHRERQARLEEGGRDLPGAELDEGVPAFGAFHERGRREAVAHHPDVHRDGGDGDLFGEGAPRQVAPVAEHERVLGLHPGRADVAASAGARAGP